MDIFSSPLYGNASFGDSSTKLHSSFRVTISAEHCGLALYFLDSFSTNRKKTTRIFVNIEVRL